MDATTNESSLTTRTGIYESFSDNSNDDFPMDDDVERTDQPKRAHSLIISSGTSSTSDHQQFLKKAKETLNLSKANNSDNSNKSENQIQKQKSNEPLSQFPLNIAQAQNQLHVQDIWTASNPPNNQRYSESIPPPYLVFLKCAGPNENIGKFSPISLAKMIRDIVAGNVKIYPNGINSVKIFCENFLDANQLLEYFAHPQSRYIASPLSTLFNKRGYIRPIDLDLGMSDLATIIDPESINNIIKLKRRIDYNKKPIDSVEITFSTTFIPRTVSIINFMFKVSPIIIPPKRCFRCQIFRHTAEQCRSTHPICEFCAEWHESEQCQNRNPNPKCNNCKNKHFASSNECPIFKYEFQVARTSYLRNLSFLDAEFWLAGRGIHRPTRTSSTGSEKELMENSNKSHDSPSKSQGMSKHPRANFKTRYNPTSPILPSTSIVASSPLPTQNKTNGFKGFSKK